MAYNNTLHVFGKTIGTALITLALSLAFVFSVSAKSNPADKAKADQQKILVLDQYYRSGNYKFGLTRVKEFSRTFSKRYDEKSLYRVSLNAYAALFSIAISDVEDY